MRGTSVTPAHFFALRAGLKVDGCFLVAMDTRPEQWPVQRDAGAHTANTPATPSLARRPRGGLENVATHTRLAVGSVRPL